ncbi:MAG: penicillin-binding protein 2 [Candidatus Margulisiibacteriota bacterium]|nr:penicillin-binding protein 2 [Candidatus Margulisiibacteriota bacterium]
MEDRKRVLILLGFFILLFLVIIVRLIDLQVVNRSFYEKKSMEQRTRIINLAAQRGDIFDRNGELLATSIDSYSVYQYRKGWLARKLSLPEATKLKEKDPKGVGLIKEKKRIYPKSRLAAQTLGFVGRDNQGLSGIELAYDEYLRGKNGKVITEGDPAGRELYGALREIESGSDGMNITLTIDGNIQYVAERELLKQIKKFGAKSGMCIVMDIKTGEILALASKPDFDPNRYQNSNRRLWHPRFLDPYEPGSTFKIFTVAAGLEDGVINRETMLRALHSITVGGKKITNAHREEFPRSRITVSKILERSINTGSVQIGQKLGPKKFYEQLRAFGFGKKTGFGLWGESNGILRNWKRWYKPDIGMITFGQSIATTPLQLLSAMSSFVNDGEMLKPILVKKIESFDGKFIKVFVPRDRGRAISSKVADEMKELMRNSVVRGTGKRADIKKFGVCGKTGTAQKAALGGRGYLKGHYIASFIGFAPYKNPRVAALVIVDDPSRIGYWGGQVAGPVFSKVVGFTLRYLNVLPDVL